MFNSLVYLIGVGSSCRISYSIVSYSYVSCSGLITRLGKRELIFLLSIICNVNYNVVSVRMGFLLLRVRYFIVALPVPFI